MKLKVEIADMKNYTGIGSRNIDSETYQIMKILAQRLSNLGYVLRSGGANGSDSAFEEGADYKEIYLPWSGFNNNDSDNYNISYKALELASELHPGWKYLSQGARKLMARNCYQVLGYELNSPSEFVVCWTKDGVETHRDRKQSTGGTGQAISLADRNNIRVFNIFNKKSLLELENYISELETRH
jgi:hypothetical protein